MQSTTHGDGLTREFGQNSQKPPLTRGVGGITPDFCKRSNRRTPGDIPGKPTLNYSRVERGGDGCCTGSWGIVS
jgi:hypothetical protein